MARTRLVRLLAAVAAIPVMTVTAQAQTSGKTTAETKHLLENDKVRVMEMVFQPGDKSSDVSRPNRFVYALTDGSLVFAPSGKTPYELYFKAGEALWLPAETTATVNENDKPVRALVVEFKNGGNGGKPAAVAKKDKNGRSTLRLQVKRKTAEPKAAESKAKPGSS